VGSQDLQAYCNPICMRRYMIHLIFFCRYMLAEGLGLSGIVAILFCGIVSHQRSDYSSDLVPIASLVFCKRLS
jgi:NhaP-type Na+/H+ or K+/H+ antiporter